MTKTKSEMITSLIYCQIQDEIDNLVKAAHQVKVSIDFLRISTNYLLDEEDIEKNFIKEPYFFNRNYSQCDNYRYRKNQDILIQVFRNNRGKKSKSKKKDGKRRKVYSHKVELVPSYTSGKKELLEVLQVVLGEKGMKRHLVKRLDISFCFPPSCSVNAFYYITDVMHKWYSAVETKLKKEYKSGTFVSYYVGKNPCRVSMYVRFNDKSGEDKGKKRAPVALNFEIQMSRGSRVRKIPFKNIRQIDVLTSFNPLNKIYFYDLPNYYVKNHTKSRLFKHTEFLVNCFAHGFGSAKALFNFKYSKHFERDIEETVLTMVKVSDKLSLKKLMKREFKKQMTQYLNS